MKQSQQDKIAEIKDRFDIYTGEKQACVTAFMLDDYKKFEDLEGEQADKLIDIYKNMPSQFETALQAYDDGWVEKWKNGNAKAAPGVNGALEHVKGESSVTSMSHFTDEDTGEVVEVTEGYIRRAHEVQGFIKGSFYLLAEGLALMADEKLYGAFGYTSFRDYCQNELDFGVRQAYRYAVIGRSVAPHLQLSDGSTDPDKKGIARLNNVGSTKLNEIIKHAEDQVEQLIKEGKISIGDMELTDEEIADRRVKELKQMLRNANEKVEKAELLEEKLRNKELENEALAEENEKLSEFEEQHRERAQNQQQVEEYLTEIETLRERVVTLMNRLDPEVMYEHSSEEQQERMVRMLDLWQKSAVRQKNKHIALVEAIWEESMDIEQDVLAD